MEIELWYDPVRPETYIKIDGQWTEDKDIYGFLYSVRHCILQTWLAPNGSWSGLEAQMRNLARGENVKLIFHGRKQDYDDVEILFDKISLISTSGLTNERIDFLEYTFVPWEIENLWRSKLKKIKEMIAEMIGVDLKNKENRKIEDNEGAILFPDISKEIAGMLEERVVKWIDDVKQGTDFENARKKTGTCCRIWPQFLDSYMKLDELKNLTQSMKRSSDMILCGMADQKHYEEVQQYSKRFSGMEFRFVTDRSKDKEEQLLYKKYGIPYVLRAELELFNQVKCRLYDIASERSALRMRQKEIIGLKKQGNATAAELREEIQCRNKIHWIDKKSKALIRLDEMIKDNMINE